jgi:hypothetical protein
MKQILFITVIVFAFGMGLEAQTLVGLSKEEVAEKMKEEHRDFHKDESVIRQRFNYLKYVNGLRTKTWIIYFNDKDIAMTSKLVCDYSDYEDMVLDLQARYRQTGENTWEFLSGSDTILVEVLKQDWYFSVRETRKQEVRE